MDSFVITLKNDKVKSYNRTGYLIAGLDFIFFIFYAISQQRGYERVVWIVLSLLILVFAYAEMVKNKRKPFLKTNISITYFLLILMWLWVSVWLAAVHLLLLILDRITKRPLQVNINKAAIEYPSFPKKSIQWDELTNIILKDDLLTIDFKNNTLIQVAIDTTQKQPEETAFNRYCEQQLKHI